MTSLTIEHRQQQRESDCLVACTQMVLNHLRIEISTNRLSRILKVEESFGLLGNLKNLSTLGLFILHDDYGDVSLFEQYLDLGLPIIAGVRTLSWRHWNELVTDHAVVVVGVNREENLIAIHDPSLPDGPLEMHLVEFEICWFEKYAQYAVVALTELE